jgi:predicted O-methyltransferase YrrM
LDIQLIKHRLFQYLKYRFTAGNRHGLHSPFAYKLYDEVIANNHRFYAFKEIENLRNSLLNNHESIEIKDFGAGSSINKNKKRKISDIAKNSLIEKKHGELLFKLVNHFKPKTVLELGTSLGISTAYLAKPISETTIYTFEGCPQTANIAQNTFNQLNLSNIKITVGDFNETFQAFLLKKGIPDFVFIDGNHTYEATINYFNILIKLVKEDTIIVFDDIYWSSEMTKAWKEIITNQSVKLSIDLYKVGILFFNEEIKVKQDFKLIF